MSASPRHRHSQSHETDEALSVVYGAGRWRIHNVSPLYNLQYKTIKLKQYAAKVRQALASTVATDASSTFLVEFEMDNKLKLSTDDSALVIRVAVNPIEGNSAPRPTYLGIFMSWGVRSSVPKCIHLPYYLERGEKKLAATVKSTLSTIFDCNIYQYRFTQHNLLQFAFNFVDTFLSDHQKQIGFVYSKLKGDLQFTNKINFDIGVVQALWTRLKDNPNSVVNTYQMLQNQIFMTFELDVVVLDLIEVTLPKAEVKSSGAVKLGTLESVKTFFKILNEISQDKIIA